MNKLTKFLIKELLDEPQTVAIYGGGFKPPTKGHFNVAEKVLADFPEIDELKIFVGSGVRDGITQDESLAIWNIYKNYLSDKVDVEPSIAPVKSVLGYAKENPDTKVYWILGAREGDEEDLKDIANRTRSIGKYPNLEVKVISTKGGVSGTKTRKAITDNNKEQFFHLIPDVEEKEEIWNIVSNIQESVTPDELKQADAFADKQLAPIDIDLTSDHVLKRLTGRDSDVTLAQLIGFFKRLGKRKKEFMDFFSKFKEIVATDDRTNLNIPFINLANKAIAKTIMRKDDFETTNPKLVFEEVEDIPQYLYHATYKPLLKKIKERGLDTNDSKKAWDDSVPGYVYLALDPYVAESYAESSEMVPDSWLDNIIILKVDTSKLDKSKLFIDQNIQDNEGDTLEYRGVIPWEALSLEPLKYQYPWESLNEVGEANLKPYKWEEVDAEGYWVYTRFVTDSETQYDVDIKSTVYFPEGQMESFPALEVEFTAKPKGAEGSSSKIVVNKGEMYRVMSTIVNIVKKYTKKARAQAIIYSPSKKSSEENFGTQRDNLYRAFISKAFPGTTFRQSGDNITAILPNNAALTLNEGRYDSLTRNVVRDIMDDWKSQFDGSNGKLEFNEDYESGVIDFELYAVLTVKETKYGLYKVDGGADPLRKPAYLEIKFQVDPRDLPQKWEDIYMDLTDVVRHELEHMTQQGTNVIASKEMADDEVLRNLIKLKFLPKSDYYKLEQEVDAMLQGMYLKAKKTKTPFIEVINNYFDKAKVAKKDRQDILDLWRQRAKALSLPLNESKEPAKGTGKKPKGSSRRLYTDEDPKDTVGIKFSTKQDIIDTLNKASFKSKSHARQSQIINVIHQRVRAAYGRAKDPEVKKRLKTALEYAEQRKEASKKKTERLKNQNNENVAPNHDGKAAPYGSGYEVIEEIAIDLSNYKGQVLPGDVLRAPKGFPLGGKKLEKSLELKVIKNSREGVNRYKLSLEDLKTGKKYSVRNFQMDGEYKGEKLPQWGLVRKSKENIKENDPFGLNEYARQFVVETFKEDWNPKEAFLSLAVFMKDNGMNVTPLPKIKVIPDDKENASHLLGKTAYYNPADKSITLYTFGRHPKDVLRSFAHEMIHHEQNLNGALGNIGTTNTNEDGDLDKIEREAYEKGNIMLRNWEDSIKNV